MPSEKNQHAIAFGKTIKNMRLEHELTQNNLADMINTERSHISDIERGIKSPSLTMIFRLAKALQTSSGELIQTVEDHLNIGNS
ncbi:MAG: helix-turn-helix transcriptional regulator [Methylophilaceae bacterium]|nr:helix-turn-helix transcriptional regulator [Methylophilaceae bacterium]